MMPFLSQELRQRSGGPTMCTPNQQVSVNGHYYERNTTSKHITRRIKRRRMSYSTVLMVAIVCILLFVAAKCFKRDAANTRMASITTNQPSKSSPGKARASRLRHRLKAYHTVKQSLDLTEDKKIQADMASLSEHPVKQVELPEDLEIQANMNSSLQDSLSASDFKLPNQTLKPGELMPLVWKSDNKQVDKYARFIGLPPQLTKEIYDFTVQTGLMDAFLQALYSEDIINARGMSSRILDDVNAKGKWSVTSPGKFSNWSNSSMHWFDVVDEAAFEETLQILKRGGFDTVLNAVGNEFQSEGLMIAGVGFTVVSHSQGSQKHSDDPGVKDRFFDLLFPLVLPENDVSQLHIGDDQDDRRISPVNFTMNTGILMSGDTAHQTGDCDYRANRGMRVAVSIYLADLNDDIAGVLAGDGTALFPVPGNTEWLMTQQGRSWGGGKSLEHDMGRLPYTAKDSDEEGCPALAQAGMCEKDPLGTRLRCQKSCGIFIEDDQYYPEVIRAPNQ